MASRGFGDLNTGNQRAARDYELVDMVKLTRDFQQFRPVGDVYGYAQHWIDIETQKGVISIPKVSLNYNQETDTFDQTIKDPYDDIPNPKRTSRIYYVNVINRDLQDDMPKKAKKQELERSEAKSGFKDRQSKSWTPMQVLRVPPTVAQMIGALKQMNKHKIKGKVTECELSDEQYGADLFISYDENRKPNAYSVNKGDASPLTPEEKKYLRWDISKLHVPETMEQARREAEALASKSPPEEDTEGDDGDDALDRKGKRDKKGKKDKDKRGGKDKDRDDRGKRDRDGGGKRDKGSKSDRSERESAGRDRAGARAGARGSRDTGSVRGGRDAKAGKAGKEGKEKKRRKGI